MCELWAETDPEGLKQEHTEETKHRLRSGLLQLLLFLKNSTDANAGIDNDTPVR